MTKVPTSSLSSGSRVCDHVGSRSTPHPQIPLLHSTVLQVVRSEAAVNLTAALGLLVQGQFFPGPPALSERLHEQRDGGEQIADARQVEGAVVCLRVVIQEPCKTEMCSVSEHAKLHLQGETWRSGVFFYYYQLLFYLL